MKRVTAAIIKYQEKILIAQRKKEKNQGLLWEFPGGKQEQGETLEDCLKREIMEELHLPIIIEKFFMDTEYHYQEEAIQLFAYFARCEQNKIDYMDSHEQIKWVSLKDLSNYTFAPADRPIVLKLQNIKL